MDRSVLVATEPGVEVEAPSIAYLIEADETVLVDTGFGPVELMAEQFPAYDCRREDGWTISAGLERQGYATDDVDVVVLSHLDWDHCYDLERFEEAEIYVQREELAYAIAPYPIHAHRYAAKSLGMTPPWLELELTPIEGERPICDGVVAFPTPGHTVGHQSVAVETAEGTTVVAADALPTFENVPDDPDDDPVAALAMDDLAWWQSAAEVRERGDRILPGHEWGILEVGPERTG